MHLSDGHQILDYDYLLTLVQIFLSSFMDWGAWMRERALNREEDMHISELIR